MKYNNKRRLFLLPFFEVAKCTKWWRKTNATNKYTNVATPLNLQPTTHTERLVALSQQFKIRKKNSRKILVLHKLHSLSIIITIKWIRASNKKRWLINYVCLRSALMAFTCFSSKREQWQCKKWEKKILLYE